MFHCCTFDVLYQAHIRMKHHLGWTSLSHPLIVTLGGLFLNPALSDSQLQVGVELIVQARKQEKAGILGSQ